MFRLSAFPQNRAPGERRALRPGPSQAAEVVPNSSNREHDIERAYQLGASGYFVKPGDPGELQAIVKSVQNYWLGETRLAMAFPEFAARVIRRPRQILGA